jgi:hypothetical protein
MTTSAHDPFSASFDSIEPTAAARSAIDYAFDQMTPSAAAPEQDAPGFHLLDDAQGRFQVDQDMGIVSVRDESILTSERLAIHAVRMRVIERSGSSYEMEMKLRLTGRVPQMVGAEDALFDIPATEAAHATAAEPQTHWIRFAAAHGATGKAALPAGAFLQPDYPAISVIYTQFSVGALPPTHAPNSY